MVHKTIKNVKGCKKEFVQPTHIIKVQDKITSEPAEIH